MLFFGMIQKSVVPIGKTFLGYSAYDSKEKIKQWVALHVKLTKLLYSQSMSYICICFELCQISINL